MELASKLASMPPVSVENIKRLVYQAIDPGFEAQLQFEARVGTALSQTEDCQRSRHRHDGKTSTGLQRQVRRQKWREMSENMTPEEVVRAWSDAYVSKDLDATAAFMSDDFIRLGDSTHWTPISKQDWREIMVNFFAAFPDWRWDMTSLDRIRRSGGVRVH